MCWQKIKNKLRGWVAMFASAKFSQKLPNHVFFGNFFLFFFFFSPLLLAQNWAATGAKATALGKSVVCVADSWAVFNNIGALAFYEKNSYVLTYQNRFGINGLPLFSAGVSLKFNNFSNSLTINRLGDDFYSQTALAYGIAHRIQNASLGLKLHLLQVSGQGLGTKTLFVFEMGGLMQLSKKLWIGASMYNLNRAKISDFRDERHPSWIKVGALYQFSEKISLTMQVQKDLEAQSQISVGLEYWLIPKIAIRTGSISQTWQQSYGCGLKLGVFSVDYAFELHPYLQATHEISLQSHFGKKRELKK